MSASNASPGGATNSSSQFLLQLLPSSRHESRADTPRSESSQPEYKDATLTAQRSPPSSDSDSDSHDKKKKTGFLVREAKPPLESERYEVSPRETSILIIWILEISMLLLAGALFLAICLILNKYGEKVLPEWQDKVGITLNALIAVLATIFRGIIAFVTFEVIAQLKWDWVSGGFRPMRDLQLFDDASRGIYGSLRLLPVIGIKQPMAIVAILVAVVSLGIGPATQQAIQTYQCLRVNEQAATITTANRINEAKLFSEVRSIYYDLNVGIQSAMQDAIVNPTNNSDISSLFDCPSGNCTFTTYTDSPEQAENERISHASLGMCSRCADVYDLVDGPYVYDEGDESPRVYRLPVTGDDNEAFPVRIQLDQEQGDRSYLSIAQTGNLSWARKAVPVDFMNEARWSVANFSVIAASQAPCHRLSNGNLSCPHFNDKPITDLNTTVLDLLAWGEPTDYTAATCILYPCIKYYTGSIKNGALSEKVVRDAPLRQQVPESIYSAYPIQQNIGNWRNVQQPCWVNDTLYTSANMSSSADLGPNATVTVQAPRKNWTTEDLDEPAGYENITAPLECVADIPFSFLYAFQTEIQETMTANCSVVPGTHDTLQCYQYNGTGSSRSSHMSALLHNRTTTIDTIRENVDSMAMRVTTEMRRAGWGPYQQTSAKVEGESWGNKVCVHVAWGWIALPAATFALCVLLLVWVISKDFFSRNGLVWKSSVLPLLLRDHEGLERMELKGVDQTAKRFEVKVEKEEG